MSHVALIGPIGAGKSTVAPLVAELLGREVVDLDALRPEFYAGLGYDDDHAAQLLEREGVAGLIGYWKPFELALVEHVAAMTPDAVLDFGAGHSHYDEPEQVRRAAAALAPHVVVLLIPSADPVESGRVLTVRAPTEHRQATRELNEAFLRSRSNADLANYVVVTANRSPHDIAAEVAAHV